MVAARAADRVGKRGFGANTYTAVVGLAVMVWWLQVPQGQGGGTGGDAGVRLQTEVEGGGAVVDGLFGSRVQSQAPGVVVRWDGDARGLDRRGGEAVVVKWLKWEWWEWVVAEGKGCRGRREFMS